MCVRAETTGPQRAVKRNFWRICGGWMGPSEMAEILPQIGIDPGILEPMGPYAT